MTIYAETDHDGSQVFSIELSCRCQYTGVEFYERSELPSGTTRAEAEEREAVVLEVMRRGQYISELEMDVIKGAAVEVGPFVYVVGAHEVRRVKIGFTASPISRIRSMRVGSPVEIEFLAIMHGSFDMEAQLHKRFAKSRSHGEWFEVTPELSEWLRSVMSVPSIRKTAIGFSCVADGDIGELKDSAGVS